jgi:cytoskeletal protein RodZ
MESSNRIKEIIDEYGVRSVSIKTNIPTDTLERLESGDYSSFTKIQILGFAKIFERDYDIDLSEFKNDIRQHFTKHAQNSDKPLLSNASENSSEGVFFKFLSYILIAGMLYGAWYIYQNYYKKDATVTTQTNNEYFDIERNKSTLDTKKESIYSIKVLEDKPQIKKKTTPKLEDNSTTKPEINTTTPLDKPIVENNNSTLDLAKDDTNTTDSTDLNTTEVLSSSESNDSLFEEPLIERSFIEIVPSQKIWFRVTNMGNHRYRTYRKQLEPHRFELSNTSWLMVVRKGSFTFIDNNVSKEYNSNTLMYFKIDKTTGVTQLSIQEYKKLGGHSAR